MNSLYQSLNQNNQQQSQNKQVSVQDILAEVKQSGMTPQQLFYKKAQEQGADVNSILQKANAMMSNFR